MAGTFLSIPVGILLWLMAAGGAHRPLLDLILLAFPSGFALLFFRVAFPPSRVLAHLEFSRDSIRFTPARMDRWAGNPTIEYAIPPSSHEILIRCTYTKYSLLIGADDGREHDTGIALLTELREPDQRELMSGIPEATGLPLRMISKRRQPDGSTVDMPWQSRSTRAKWAAWGKVVFGTAPFWGGAIVGYHTSDLALIGLAGFALWLTQTLALFAYARFGSKPKKFPWLYWICTIFTFGGCYAAIAVFVSYQVHPR